MKQSGKIALIGLLSALAIVVLLLTVFPSAAYALSALAGVVLLPVTLEHGPKWGFAAYAVTAFFAFLFTPSWEAKMLFLTFFGYYPALKVVLERLSPRILVCLLKLLFFNAAIIGSYAVLIHLFHFSLTEFELFGINFAGGFLILGNIIMLIFDYAITGLIQRYFQRIHPFVARLFHH